MPFLPASNLTPEPLDWLWPNRLAAGKLSLLEGDPDMGKSWVTCDLCARLSVGREFPDGSGAGDPDRSLIVNAEDGPADTLRTRLAALGADLANVMVHDPKDGDSSLVLPDDVPILDEAVERHMARLVVLDPLTAFLDPALLAGGDAPIRKALRPLADLARRRRCCVLLVRHLTKRGSGRSIYRGAGSIGLVAACRSAWLLARDPVEPNRYVFAQVKNNLAPPQPSLAYEFKPRDKRSVPVDRYPANPIENQQSKFENPHFAWLGHSGWTAEELARSTAADRGPIDRARRFLHDMLEEGARDKGEITAAARRHHIARSTLFRARKELSIASRRVILNCKAYTYWLLPNQPLPTHIPAEAVVPE